LPGAKPMIEFPLLNQPSAVLCQELLTGRDRIELEATLLDLGRWDEWLALFAEDVRYWVPTWRSDGQLTTDPQTELAHIFYESRKPLEDRVARFTSSNSPASNPAPRTTHLLSGFRLLQGSEPGLLQIGYSWATHVFFPQRHASHAFFGFQRETLVQRGESWLIRAKTVIIQNDYIPTMLDVYCL
jgi:3-phenylpropionate/cinnamic acid dioxygenase small subunit